ncbi:MAG: nitroreductase family protein [Candidatus Bathyarchaeia archaeon]
MDLFEAINLRRSIRAFTGDTVSDEDVMKLINAARRAPSAGNIQPWEFVIVRKPENKRRLAAAALYQSFIEEAPVVIVVCADERRSGRGYGSRGVDLYCIQDTAAATQNILLAACALGLGACWVGAFNERGVRSILKLPQGVRPVAIVPIGHPAERPQPRYRRRLQEIIHFETF